MGTFAKSLRQIPYWAYMLVIFVVIVNTLYLSYKVRVPCDALLYNYTDTYGVIVDGDPSGPGYMAGIRLGDTLVSVNHKPFNTWLDGYQGKSAGDSGMYQIRRNGRDLQILVVLGKQYHSFEWFFWVVYLFMLVLSVTSLYMLVKRTHDKAVIVFFIYLQLFSVGMNAMYIPFREIPAAIANTLFTLISAMLGPILIHFHMLFPKPLKILERFKRFPLVLYSFGTAAFLLYNYFPTLLPVGRLDLKWLALTFLLAMAAAVYQFVISKDTLARNQLRIIVIGTFIGLLTPVFFAFFYDFIDQLRNELYTIIIPHGICSMIMIGCILIAIFRYRIWNIEIFIRKALLYMGALGVIVLTFLFMVWIVDRWMIRENTLVRFVILGVSVIVFLVLRDRIQRLIDRLFHRETYDSATVVSDFEARLAGTYRLEELKQKIFQAMNEIFHFKSFVFALKKKELIYEPAFVYGIIEPITGNEYTIFRETEEKLKRSKIFSPEELNNKPPLLQISKGDLVVPMLSENQPAGFFICGQKKSERIYSRQDINVLSLLSRRVIALLHTAALYEKDLDRQLMLERERARISQDMHDDIGAGLTKIAMISEAPVNAPDIEKKIGERMSKVAASSREMISRLNVIVWALNPKYDNLESLVTYLRRYFGEYLENFGIRFKTHMPDIIPEITMNPDTRRNIFYAIQEAIHNGVKHGDCLEIGLKIEISQHSMEITVQDNGKGFDQVKSGSGGNGLLNMRKRAEELGGSFEITSSPGEGTRVLFKFILNTNQTKGGLT